MWKAILDDAAALLRRFQDSRFKGDSGCYKPPETRVTERRINRYFVWHFKHAGTP